MDIDMNQIVSHEEYSVYRVDLPDPIMDDAIQNHLYIRVTPIEETDEEHEGEETDEEHEGEETDEEHEGEETDEEIDKGDMIDRRKKLKKNVKVELASGWGEVPDGYEIPDRLSEDVKYWLDEHVW